MARTGLRMMPTFPSSPLKFRTVGFPQYGFKAGYQAGPSRVAPDHRVTQFAAAARAPRVHRGALRAVSEPLARVEHRRESDPCRSTPGALAPVRVLLSRSILTYSAPSAPLAGTSRLHRPAADTRCLRCVCPPRRPTSGSVLSLRALSRHVVLSDPEESGGCLHPVPSPSALAFTLSGWAQHSPPSHHPLQVGLRFRGFTGSHCYDLPNCLPPRRIRPGFPSRRRLLLPGFRRVGHPSRRRI